MKKTNCLALLLALVLPMCFFTGCGKSDGKSVPVQSVAAILGYPSLGENNAYGGVVISQNEVKVEKDGEKTVGEVLVKVGDLVEKGQTLFTYDTDNLQLSVDKKKLEIEQADNTMTTYKAQIAQLEKEKASAPQSEQLSYTVQIQSVQTDLKELEYNYTTMQRELESLEASLKDNTVTAPISGKVQSLNESGATDSYGNPKPFLTLMEIGAFRVKGTINEMNQQDFVEGARVCVRSRVDRTQVWTGSISKIEWNNPDSSDNDGAMYYTDFAYNGGGSGDGASTYPFYVELDDATGLMLGQHVYIELDCGQADETALYLPAAYLVQTEDGAYVWAANGKNKLEKRTVTLGSYDEAMDRYEIVSGLTTEDYIAVPADGLASGQSVSRYDASDFSSEPAAQPDTGDLSGGEVDGGAEDYPVDDPNGAADAGIVEDTSEDGGAANAG